MLIEFVNGVTLSPIVVTSAKRMVQGITRDTLSFIFPAEANINELKEIFTSANCEKIKIIETIPTSEGNMVYTNEYLHEGYTICEFIKRELIMTAPETPQAAAVYEQRITVSMAQRTYAESQLAALTLLLEGEV